MERTFDDGDAVPLGEATGGAHCAHHGFGARVGETHFVDLRAQRFDLLHHEGVEFGGKAGEGAALCDLFDDGLVHTGIAVAQDDGPVAQTEIDKVAAIFIGQGAALGMGHKHGAVFAPITVVLGHALRHVQMRFGQQTLLLAHGRSRWPTRSSSNFTTCNSAASGP